MGAFTDTLIHKQHSLRSRVANFCQLAETRKNTYDASYEETFSLDVEDAAVGVRSDLAVTVWDWDATSQDDLVGSVKISSARVSEMLRGSLGVNGQHTFNVISKGIPVVGHNKDMCTLTLYAKVCEVPLAFSSILPEGEASGPRRLEVTLSSVKHLPKMDGILGTTHLISLLWCK